MPSTMLAIRKLKNEPGLWLQKDTPIPEIGPREVLVAVTHAGICGTDRHIYEWDAWSKSRVKIGITTGHEFVGRVMCQPCRTGNGHICEKVDILGIDTDGCFAEFVAVPEENIWPVHPDIPDHIAAVFDPLGNAMHTVMAAGVSGRSVLITGVGIIGLMAVTIARAAGAGKILVTDVSPRRLEMAKKIGADVTFDSKDDDWPRTARELTHDQGPEVLLEISGHPKAIRQGFTALRNGGTAALLGLPSEPVPLDLPNDIIFKGATVLGINGRKMFETWYQVENFLLSGRLNLEPIVTHHLPLTEFERGLKMMQAGEAIKVVLEIQQQPVSMRQG